MSGTTLLALVLGGACFLGWRKAAHSKRAFVALLVLAILSSAALWSLVVMAGTMPRGARELDVDPGGRLLHSVIVATETHALLDLADDGIARLSLADASMEPLASSGDIGLVTQAVARGEHIAFTTRGRDGDGFRDSVSLLGPDGFVIAPGDHRGPADHGLAVTLDPEGEGFVVVDAAAGAPVTLTPLGLDGALSEPTAIPAEDCLRAGSACFSDGTLHLAVMELIYRVDDGRCEQLDLPTIACPGSNRLLGFAHVLMADGLEPAPVPPGGQTFSEVYTRFGSGPPVMVSSWITMDYRNVVRLGPDRSLGVSYLDESQTGALGFVDDAAYFTLLDDAGTVLAARPIARWTFAAVKVFVSGDEILIIDQGLSRYARLDASTLARLDAPELLPSIRTRLAVWGGDSVLFELLLALGLLLSVILWPLMLAARGERFSRQRALVVGCAVLIPATLLTLRRLFML